MDEGQGRRRIIRSGEESRSFSLPADEAIGSKSREHAQTCIGREGECGYIGRSDEQAQWQGDRTHQAYSTVFRPDKATIGDK